MDGHVIARIFPAVKPNKHQQLSHSSRNPKPQHAIIDPATLRPNTGHLRYRPQRAYIVDSASWKDGLDIEGNATLDVYLYTELDKNEDPIHLIMNRDSKELVSKTLTRLELSLTKKLNQHDRSRDSSESKKHNMNPQTSSMPPTISVIDTVTSQPRETWDISKLKNGDWIHQALMTPCLLHLRAQSDNPALTERRLLVEACPPTITAVQTYEEFNACMFVGIPILVDVETQFAEGCSVDWFVIDDDGEARRIAENCPLFTPTEDLIGASLAVLLTPFNEHHDGRGQEEAYRFQQTVQNPSENTVLRLRSPAWTLPPTLDVVRVVSYNILADQNAFQTGNQMPFYPYCSKEVLERARRLPLILQELVAYQPGVMCLQEVDQIVYESLLRPVLSSLDWDGYYTIKKHAGTKEGCAVFWARERFDVVDKQWFNLGELSSKLHAQPTASDWSACLQTLERLLKSQKSLKYVIKSQLGHVVQMIRLVDRRTQQRVLVANTHLFYHPDASHVRLIQMLLIARQLSMEVEKDKDNPPQVILCGDFNSSLENAAGKLMVDRMVPTNFRDLKTHLNTFDFGVAKATSPPNTDFDFPAFELPDSVPLLRSAFAETPAFTHCIAGFQATLDHVLTTMESVGTAPMPSMEQVTANVAMPSETLPSDHVSIVCDLKY